MISFLENLYEYSIRGKFILAAISFEFSLEHLDFLIRKFIISGVHKNIADFEGHYDGIDGR